MEILFRSMENDDWAEVAAIYKQGIESENATFQKELPTAEEWDRSHVKACRIVAIAGDKMAGWAALTMVSGRAVYAGVAEVSVYVANAFHGQKIGTNLLDKLITESEKENFWTLQAGIFPENTSSLIIHERMGFRKVGYRERIGQMDGRWRDTILLERRSKIAGIN